MITITATIDILSGNSENLSIPSNFEPDNNPRSAKLSEVIGSTNKGGNPLLLGYTKLSSKPTLNSQVPFFITEGIVLNGLKIDKSETNNITIKFDTHNNNFPQTIKVNGTEYLNDDPIFTVKVPAEESTINFDFINWKIQNEPKIIESIYSGAKIIVDKRNMLSYNGIIQKKADEKLPSWGIVSTTGELSFKDTNGEVADYAEQDLLVKGLEIHISLRDTTSKRSSYRMNTLKSETWNYENNSRDVSVSLIDDLPEWQDIFVEGFNYDPRKAEITTAKDVYEYLYSKTPQRFNMKQFGDLSTATKNILSITKIPYKILKDGTLWEQWTKLCELCACHIYKDNFYTNFNYGG